MNFLSTSLTLYLFLKKKYIGLSTKIINESYKTLTIANGKNLTMHRYYESTPIMIPKSSFLGLIKK